MDWKVTGEGVEMVDRHGPYLDLVDWTLDAGDILHVQWFPRTTMGTFGNHVVACTARVIVALPSGKVGAVRIEAPEGVKKLRDWLAIQAAYTARAA